MPVGKAEHGGGMIEEALLTMAPDQGLARLRDPFATASGTRKPAELFPRSPGVIRIATPSSKISWDERALSGHLDPVVRAQADRLIEAASA